MPSIAARRKYQLSSVCLGRPGRASADAPSSRCVSANACSSDASTPGARDLRGLQPRADRAGSSRQPPSSPDRRRRAARPMRYRARVSGQRQATIVQAPGDEEQQIETCRCRRGPQHEPNELATRDALGPRRAKTSRRSSVTQIVSATAIRSVEQRQVGQIRQASERSLDRGIKQRRVVALDEGRRQRHDGRQASDDNDQHTPAHHVSGFQLRSGRFDSASPRTARARDGQRSYPLIAAWFQGAVTYTAHVGCGSRPVCGGFHVVR